jgi:hypothetical protein
MAKAASITLAALITKRLNTSPARSWQATTSLVFPVHLIRTSKPYSYVLAIASYCMKEPQFKVHKIPRAMNMTANS